MKIKILSVIILAIFFSCSNTNQEKSSAKSYSMQEFNWLLGTWENYTDDGIITEEWQKKHDSLFSGSSFMISNGDTTFFESIELVMRNDELFYVPSVKNQNDGKPVYFKFVSFENGEYIFENKEHDFPQRIIYSNPEKDSLSARIEGIENGAFRKEIFSFKRSLSK